MGVTEVAALTPEARKEAGRALRSTSPRRAHGAWKPPPNRADPISILEKQAETRVPELIPLRHGRMLASAFTFYRGNAAIMAADLAETASTGMRAQLCGDAHLSNFGGFAAPDRQLVFDVNDFDETLPGPWEWDVKRMAASFEIAGRDRGFGRKDRRRIVETAVRSYRTSMQRMAGMKNLDLWYLRLNVDDLRETYGSAIGKRGAENFERNVAKARAKGSMRAFSKLVKKVDGELRIAAQPPIVTPFEELMSESQADEANQVLARALELYRETLSSENRHLLDGYRFVHAARKVVGVGSVGTRAFIALFVGRDEGDPLFLQIKEAEASVLEPFAGASEVSDHGHRVVQGQRLTQAAGDVLLGWVTTPGFDGVIRHFYVRQLWDEKASARVDLMSPRVMTVYAEICGSTMARAHARSGDRIAIAGYLGSGTGFDEAIGEFSSAYADQNELDFEAMAEAVRSGRIQAVFEEDR